MSNGTYVCGQCGDVADNDHPCDCCCMAGPGPRTADVDALLENARNHVMTDAEREAQRQSWARGQSTPGPRQAVVVAQPKLDDVSSHVLGVLDQIETVYRQGDDLPRLIAFFRRDYDKPIASNTADAQDEKETP